VDCVLVTGDFVDVGHTFCQACIEEWLAVNNVCPKCRTPVTSPPLPNSVLDETLWKCIVETKDFGDDAAQEYQERLQEWEQEYAAAQQRTAKRKEEAPAAVVASPQSPEASPGDPLTISLVRHVGRRTRCSTCNLFLTQGEAVVSLPFLVYFTNKLQNPCSSQLFLLMS